MVRGRFFTKTFWIFGAIFCVVVGVATVSVFGFGEQFFHGDFRGDFDHRKPTISWTPDTIVQTISAGDVTNITATFTPSINVHNVSLSVTRRLRQFVQISPTNLPSLVKGTPVNVTITVHPPATALPMWVRGAVCVNITEASSSRCGQDDDDDARSVDLPLPVFVKIAWQQLKEDAMGITLTYPPSYVPSISSSSNLQQIAFSQSQEALTNGIEPALLIVVQSLPSGESVHDWISSFGVSDSNIQNVVIGGSTYQQWSEPNGEADQGAISYSRALPNNKVLTVVVPSSSLASSPTLNVMISSLSITAP